MQRIKLDVFQTLFTKNLTGNEIDFILALSHMQDERGCVCGLHYKEMMAETGMSAQAFYDCKKSKCARENRTMISACLGMILLHIPARIIRNKR